MVANWNPSNWRAEAVGLGVVWLIACGSATPPAEVGPAPTVQEAPPMASRLGLTRGVGDAADRSLLEGEQHYFQRDWLSAERAFQRAQSLLPEHPAPLVGLVLVGVRKRELAFEYASTPGDEWVAAQLDRLLRFPSQEPFAPRWLACGRLALMLGQGQRAVDCLTRAQGLSATAEIEGALGIAYLSLGRTEQAVAQLERAVELAPDDAAHWTNLGAALMMQEAPERAREAYGRAVQLAPNDARARSDLGTTLIALGQSRAALVHLERAHELEPERATVMNNLGFALQSLGELEQALAWYQRALARDEALGSAWLNLGVARAQQGRLDEAERAFQRALALDPEDPRALANLRDLEQLRQGAGGTP